MDKSKVDLGAAASRLTGQIIGWQKLYFMAVSDGQIKIWEDPGHEWIQVPIGVINALVKEKGLKVSGCSYRDKDYGYLECDEDGQAFIEAIGINNFKYARQSGQIQTDYRENIFIRNLNRF